MPAKPIHPPISRNEAVSRKTVIFIQLILTVSLTTLGLRLPAAAGVSVDSGKPTPRPKAVINSQIKTCKQIVKPLAERVTFIPERVFIDNAPESLRPVCLYSVYHRNCTSIFSSTPRAPPSSSFSG